jgi:hypothetical protein
MKTGVMTEEDVELIRRLRSEQKFNYDHDRKGSNSSFIDLDSLRNNAKNDCVSHHHKINRL